MNAPRSTWRLAAVALIAAAAAGLPAVHGAPVAATAPTATVCNGNPSFCGYTLHAKNGSTSVLPSKSFGAHMGVGWQMATGPNNSTALGFCLDDQFGGVP
ncbi:MAG: hypothetical protein KDB06_15030, partial [Ilumatobacter sp.]|nr:hypothetical protein [Ilumatobacter sp.]